MRVLFLGALLALPAVGDDAPPKNPRKAIYDEKANAEAAVAKAVASARKENRRVLIQWGGNWCGWCHLLHDAMRNDRDLATTLRNEFDLVLVDSNSSAPLAARYGAELAKHGVPYLTVLDGEGKVLANQRTDPFETKAGGKNGHDPRKVREFLVAHQATPRKAAAVLAAALEEAGKTDRVVLLHFGAPWCGWCHRLDAWLARPEVAAALAKDFVEVKIDTDRMEGGKAALAKFPGADKGGIPWFAILDAKGKALATSDGPQGNVGFPASEAEIAHFVAMLKATRKRLSDAEVAALAKSLAPPPKPAR